jgi:hypothetical protein
MAGEVTPEESPPEIDDVADEEPFGVLPSDTRATEFFPYGGESSGGGSLPEGDDTGDPFLTASLPPDAATGAKSRSAAPLVLVAGLLAVLGIGVAGFFAFSGGDDAAETSGDISVHSMEVGMCWNDPSGLEFGSFEVLEVDAVACSDPHDNEVYALADYPASEDAPYPGDIAIENAALDLCRAAFAPFTGVAYEQSILDIFYIYPTIETWIEGDREIVCSLYRIDAARLTGSQAGLALQMDDTSVDVGQATDCMGLANLTVDVVAETVAVFDTLDLDDTAALEELPPELLPAVKNEVLLVNRATDLGCDMNLLNDLVSAGASRLTAETEFGQVVLDGIVIEGFFVP